jgi:hypothetical protein
LRGWGIACWAPALLVTALLASCSKAAPKRAKRAHHTGGAPGTEDQALAPGAAAPPAAQPVPMAVRVPDPSPSPPPRRALTVDTNPTPPPPEPAPRRSARVASARPLAAAPAPAPRPVPKPVDDKPRGTTCEATGGHGELLSVTGVAADDVLNVREAPDRASAILGGLPPDTTGVRGTSNRKRVGGSSWREIECGKIRGWVNERFLAAGARN